MSKLLLNLSDISVADLVNLEDEVEATLTTVFKVDTRRASLSFERRMADSVTRAWKKVANAALTSSLKKLAGKKKFTAKTVKAFLARIGLALKDPLTPAQVEILGKRIQSIYKVGKKLAAKESKISLSFKAKDARAIAAINKQQVLWVGDFYSTHLSERIAAVTDEILLQRGLGAKEAGKELGQVLKREFGIVPGGSTKAAPSVPARYAGNPDHYFRQLASTAGHRARVFGKMSAFEEAGVTRYRLTNPMDDRTGRVCFGAGALVLLADGTQLPIEAIEPGMLVITANGNVRSVSSVIRRIAHKWHACRSFGGLFTITPDHEIMTANGWKAVGDLYGEKDKVRVFDVWGGIRSLPVTCPSSGSGEQSAEVLQQQVLPQPPKANALAQTSTDRSGQVDSRKRLDDCGSIDLRPTWCSKENTESGIACGLANLIVSDPLFYSAAAYNLKIDGDDPTYVVAGVAVHNCQIMDGQEFEVATGVKHMNKILDAKSPKQVKAIDPWLSADDLESKLGNAKPGSEAATDALVAANQILPPFHPLCRTEPIVVFQR